MLIDAVAGDLTQRNPLSSVVDSEMVILVAYSGEGSRTTHFQSEGAFNLKEVSPLNGISEIISTVASSPFGSGIVRVADKRR